MSYSIMDYGFCEKCGDDNNVYYCKMHKVFICFKCDTELHSKINPISKTL
jgi:hypothetical protein